MTSPRAARPDARRRSYAVKLGVARGGRLATRDTPTRDTPTRDTLRRASDESLRRKETGGSPT